MSEEQLQTRWLEKQAHMLEYARPVKSIFDAIPITPEEAKKIADEFERLFPLVAEWRENLKTERKEQSVKKPASVQAPLSQSDIQTLNTMEQEYGLYLAQIDVLTRSKEILRTNILTKLESLYGHCGATYTNPGTGNSLQRVIQVRQDADSEAVKAIVSPEVWNKIKKETVDMTKLAAAIQLGEVDSAALNKAIKSKTVDTLRWVKG